jgi:hypothetical protein
MIRDYHVRFCERLAETSVGLLDLGIAPRALYFFNWEMVLQVFLGVMKALRAKSSYPNVFC